MWDKCGITLRPSKCQISQTPYKTGAADKNRTYDPVITNDVLYH